MTAEQVGSFLGAYVTPAVVGLWLGNNIRKDNIIRKQAKTEGLTYRQMKDKLKVTKLKNGGKIV